MVFFHTLSFVKKTFRVENYLEFLGKKYNKTFEAVPIDLKNGEDGWVLISCDLGIERAEYNDPGTLYYKMYPKNERQLPYFVPKCFAQDETMFRILKTSEVKGYLYEKYKDIYDYSFDSNYAKVDYLEEKHSRWYDTKSEEDMQILKDYYKCIWGTTINETVDLTDCDTTISYDCGDSIIRTKGRTICSSDRGEHYQGEVSFHLEVGTKNFIVRRNI